MMPALLPEFVESKGSNKIMRHCGAGDGDSVEPKKKGYVQHCEERKQVTVLGNHRVLPHLQQGFANNEVNSCRYT